MRTFFARVGLVFLCPVYVIVCTLYGACEGAREAIHEMRNEW